MGWLEDALASIAASGEAAVNLGPPMTEREREMQALVKGGGYGVPDASGPGIRMALGDGPAPVPSGRIPFGLAGDPMTADMVPGEYPRAGDPMTADRTAGPSPFPVGTDPMTAGGMRSNGPGGDMAAAQLVERLRASNPALRPMAPGPQMDPSMMANPAEWSPFGPPPVAAPQMDAQAGIPGLNSPFGGSGAPFSIAGMPPSMAAAKQMTAPPPPAAPPAPPLAAVPPEVAASPGAAAAPLAAMAAAPPGAAPAGAPTDASARRRDVPPAAAAAAVERAAAEPTFTERLRAGGGALADALRESSPHLIALGAGLQGEGWNTAASLAAARNKRAEDLQLQAQQGTATARLLASKGASPQEIAAAVAGGPDTVKALLGQYLSKDKFAVVQSGEDKYGSKTFKVFNSTDGTFKEVEAKDAAEAKDTVQRQELEGVTGAARLAALEASDPAYARKVKAAVNGDISLPTGRTAMQPAGRKFIEDVLGVDGTVSEADFKIRQQVRKNYTSGKDFQVTKSINTVVDHGIQLEKAIKGLNNNNYFSAITNPVRDAYLSQTDPKYIEAKKEYTVNAENFAREMDFALSGGRPTVSGAQHQREAFDALSAQVGQQAALKKSIELLDARLKEHQRGYEESLPPGTKDAIVPKLEKKTTDFIERMTGKNAPAAAKPAAAGQVKVGDKVIPWSVN